MELKRLFKRYKTFEEVDLFTKIVIVLYCVRVLASAWLAFDIAGHKIFQFIISWTGKLALLVAIVYIFKVQKRITYKSLGLCILPTIYIILILLYIKFIYNDDNYDSLMMYFITLAVGRFIYFDFTMDDFLSTIHGFWEELPLLILMTSYSGFICWFGFHIGFLLTSNGVIVSTLLAHLFMVCSIFILDKTRILRLVM